jgi:hypothetical protein
MQTRFLFAKKMELRRSTHMRQFFTTHPWASFTLRTAIYVVIILALVYLYGYSGVSNSKFIYNEF